MNRLFSTTLFLSLLLAPTMVFPCGMSTHIEVSQRASWFFDASAYPEYQEMMLEHPEALQAGAPFPDWGYSLPDLGDASEEAHWDPFIQATAEYIRQNYPPPWDPETEKFVCFLMGLTSHSVADISWHGLGVEEGFIDLMKYQDFHGDGSAAHTAADTGGDMIVAYELDQSYMSNRWYVPIEDIVAIYHELGYDEVTPQSVAFGNLLLYVGAHAEKAAGQLLFPYTAKLSPTLVAQFQDYFVGGLDDMSIFSAWKWIEVIDWLEGSVSENAPVPHNNIFFNNFNMLRDKQGGDRLHTLKAVKLGLLMLSQGQLQLELERTSRGLVIAPPSASGSSSLQWASSLLPLDHAPPRTYVARGLRELRTLIEQSAPDLSLPPASAKAVETYYSAAEPIAPNLHLAQTKKSKAPSQDRTTSLPFFEGPLYTLETPYAHLGTSLASGDFDGDGIDDLVMGAPGFGAPGQPQRGAIFLVHGSAAYSADDIELSAAEEVLMIKGQEDYARLGWALAVLDFNADGYLDLAASAPTAGAADMGYHGKILIYFGHGAAGLSSGPDLILTTDEDYTNLGQSLSTGDCDGDGFSDLLLGAPFARAGGMQRGLAALFLASPERQSGEELALTQADWLEYGEEDFDWFGQEVQLAESDVHGRILLVSAPTAQRDGLALAGKLYGYLLDSLDSGVNGTPLFSLTGTSSFSQMGQSFSVGDLIGCQCPILALSSPVSDVGHDAQAGLLSLFRLDDLVGDLSFDQLRPLSQLAGSRALARFGWKVGLSRVNQDSFDELWVSAPWRISGGQVEAGGIFLWKGGTLESDGPPLPDTGADAMLEGDELAGQLGSEMIFPDLNGDGLADVVVSSRQSSLVAPVAGTVSVFINRPDSLP